ncbi:MAG: nucleotidyltransferase family protein [Desulfobacterales bacterium]|nr:nucleotidyltransferase family protein [Desulfobacterales bacterium]
MKAFLLAAGKGTRLRPYTDNRPKCLMPVQGKPLLEIWIDLFEAHGVDGVLVNTHHFAGQVEQTVARLDDEKTIEITTVYEPELLGSGGTILKNREFIEADEDFLIAYADNLTDINLSAMVAFHGRQKAVGKVLTMGLFRTTMPTACGIAVLDADHTVTGFEEKPENPESNLANAGIYVATYSVLDACREIQQGAGETLLDFGFHVLPRLVGRMGGYEIQDYLTDIGTVTSYERALEEWPRR